MTPPGQNATDSEMRHVVKLDLPFPVSDQHHRIFEVGKVLGILLPQVQPDLFGLEFVVENRDYQITHGILLCC